MVLYELERWFCTSWRDGFVRKQSKYTRVMLIMYEKYCTIIVQ